MTECSNKQVYGLNRKTVYNVPISYDRTPNGCLARWDEHILDENVARIIRMVYTVAEKLLQRGSLGPNILLTTDSAILKKFSSLTAPYNLPRNQHRSLAIPNHPKSGH